MSQFLTSNELFINIKNPPKWNPKKNFFDQQIDVIDFYLDERRKITEGITVGGYYIHPWLYWHLNFFKTPIPTKDGKEMIMNPPLDDNMLFVIENYKEAEEKGLGLMLFGSRGFTKSSFLASLITWLNSTKANGTTSIMGGNDGDLKSISNLLKVGFNNVNPAMFIPQLIQEWDNKVELGIKEKDGFRLPHSHISITNAAAGTDNSSEKGAGLSPVGFILDEAGKWSFKKVLKSALPSFKTQYGMKLVPILCGTSGNQDLSKDAKDVLLNPEAYDILPMNWDTLDRRVDPEYITWERSKKDKFGTFVPGQMSYRLPVPKKKTNLSEYLGVDDEDLKNIKVNETDWEKASTFIKTKNDSFKKEEDRESNRMYFPLEIADVFITASSNPFPTAIIDKHIRKLEDEGITGKSVNIYKHNGEYKQEFSAKKLAEVSHGGGEADAPILLFGELPETAPPKYTNVSGLDDYKLDQSDTDSLGAFYVLRRRNLEMNSPCETILASYVSRPFRHSDFHKTGETLIEAFQAVCMMEAVDVSFKQHLDTKYKSEQLLAPSISFSNSSQNGTAKLNSKFGIYPTGGNKTYMFNILIDYCTAEHVIGIDDDGNEIIKYGVEYILDIALLKEMLSYKKGGNFDRITAFMHALAYARELDKNNVRPQEKRKPTEYNNISGPKKVGLSVFGTKRPSAF
jgi:hypothetical protein